MIDALCIMGRGLGQATTEIVTIKYGEKMGEATKEGLDCIGNVGMIAKVYSVEGAKMIEKKMDVRKS